MILSDLQQQLLKYLQFIQLQMKKKLLNNGIFQQGTLYFTLHNMCVHIHKYNS